MPHQGTALVARPGIARLLDGIAAPPLDGEPSCARPGVEPDTMFPVTRYGLYEARRLCWSCPAAESCLRQALDAEGNAGVSGRHGVYAGFTPAQRRKLYTRGKTAAQALAESRPRPAKPHPANLAEAVDTRVEERDGHLIWHGPAQIRHRGRLYRPVRAAWEVRHGAPPSQHLTQACEVDGCIEPDHYAYRTVMPWAADATAA